MRVLHLFSNWKWTGPAELAVNLAAGLARRGVSVFVGCCRAPRGRQPFLLEQAHAHGLRNVSELHLDKHFRPASAVRAVHEIRRLIRHRKIDLVHTHLPNDHLLGGIAARLERNRPIVIRSDYDGFLSRPTYRARLALDHLTDHLVLASELALNAPSVGKHLPADRMSMIRPGVDTARFTPDGPLPARLPAQLTPDAIVAGIVARVQPHRQFGLLLEAFAEAVRAEPRLHLAIVGRGTHIDRLARRPAARLGLDDRVIFTGHLRGEQYVAALKAFDFQIFLVPGSDATCRAARQGMALGKPLIVSKRGILPELVAHGKCGVIVNETRGELAAALLRLAGDKPLRDRLGSQARRRIVTHYTLARQAALIEALYTRLLKNRQK